MLISRLRSGLHTSGEPGLHEVDMSLSIDSGRLLTGEERAALGLAATGLVTHEIAEAMEASPDQVRVWLASAVRKLGARSKLEAVLLADRQGLLDLRP
jgi:DNA-binding NarL/FixJ family response regulator